MKNPTEMTDAQLVSWLKKTEESGRNALYSSVSAHNSTRYSVTLKRRWESIASELLVRGIKSIDGREGFPSEGGARDAYTWGDITC